jgi:hypothetical protein
VKVPFIICVEIIVSLDAWQMKDLCMSFASSHLHPEAVLQYIAIKVRIEWFV